MTSIVGEHVSELVNMLPKEVIDCLPNELFERSSVKAAIKLAQSVLLFAAGVAFLYFTPWYLLPITWLWLGIVLCGLYAVAYHCSQDRFFNEMTCPSWLNKIVGAVCMLPLLIPFENFRLMHENKQQVEKKKDLPSVTPEPFVESPLWFLSSIRQWLSSNIYFESKKSVVVNVVCLYIFAAIIFSVIIWTTGLAGLIKYYVGPFIAYHFVMATFLKADFEEKKKRNGSAITNFPHLIETLSNYANHSYQIRVRWQGDKISSLLDSIPAYNLGKAKRLLKNQLGSEKLDIFASFSPSSLIKDYDNVDWTMATYLLGSLALSIYGIFTCGFAWQSYLLCFALWHVGGISITMGYHRLFAHRSYRAHWLIRYPLLVLGTSTFQGPILQWASDHRLHHKYTDTDRDPYNITKGFNYAHWGWLFHKNAARNKLVDVEDLQADPVIMFQFKYYAPLALFLGYGLPCLVAGYFWGDYRGGFLIGGVLCKTLLQHCTFFINSLAHTWGEANWSDGRTARDSHLVSFMTWGEGIHNFHHEFPHDYRNGVHWHHYDPGKWLIWITSKLRLTWDLKRVDNVNYTKGHLQMLQKKLDEKQQDLDKKKRKMNWGPHIEDLPWIERNQITKDLIIIDDIAHDVSKFTHIHPGGAAIVKPFMGKDATKAFNGGIYNHSNSARNVLATLRKYRVRADNNVGDEVVA
jgi:stearoyl-CoA desaturase (delta-9 desaturase)